MRVSATPLVWCSAALIVLISLIVPTRAHHSRSPFYDSGRKIKITGPVARFLFGSPTP